MTYTILDTLLEVSINEPENFLKIKETLTRIGVASKKENKLFQSCHILHKRGKYYITHFKEMFALDGKETNITMDDIARRNTIGYLLRDWGLLEIVEPASPDIPLIQLQLSTAPNYEIRAPLSQIKIIPFKEKHLWELVSKYNIGKKRT